MSRWLTAIVLLAVAAMSAWVLPAGEEAHLTASGAESPGWPDALRATCFHVPFRLPDGDTTKGSLTRASGDRDTGGLALPGWLAQSPHPPLTVAPAPPPA